MKVIYMPRGIFTSTAISDREHPVMDEAFLARVRTSEMHITEARRLADLARKVLITVAGDLLHERDNHPDTLLVHHLPEVSH